MLCRWPQVGCWGLSFVTLGRVVVVFFLMLSVSFCCFCSMLGPESAGNWPGGFPVRYYGAQLPRELIPARDKPWVSHLCRHWSINLIISLTSQAIHILFHVLRPYSSSRIIGLALATLGPPQALRSWHRYGRLHALMLQHARVTMTLLELRRK